MNVVVRGSLLWYSHLWDTSMNRTDPISSKIIELSRRKLLQNKLIYSAVALQSAVPWWVIACIHMRESSNDLRCLLHNGERIIGIGRKTTLVPKNRGPFTSWEEAALDALTIIEKPDKWTIEKTLRFFELYNGLGYLKHHPDVLSPYLWSCTHHYKEGKSAADGKFNKHLVDKQCGVATMIKELNVEVQREQYT